MAPAGRRKAAALITSLKSEPQRFEFFAAVRWLVRMARASVSGWPWQGEIPGGDAGPEREAVRFRSHQSRTYAASAVHKLKPPEKNKPPELVVTVMGLTGPNGILPRHYSQLVLDTLRQNHTALADFFDLFNHRAISLYYRAWAKYRLPVSCEPSLLARDFGAEDPVTRALYALVGLGSADWQPATNRSTMRGQLKLRDDTFLYFAGAFSNRARNVVTLERMLQELLQSDVRVKQFQGQWMNLAPTEQSQLATKSNPLGVNAALGETALAGSRVWNVDSKIRVEIGPLDLRTFRRFTPAGDLLRPISQFIRTYVGPSFDFDILPILAANAVPQTQSMAGMGASRLGWDTWVRAKPYPRDAVDAVFAHSGQPEPAAQG